MQCLLRRAEQVSGGGCAWSWRWATRSSAPATAPSTSRCCSDVVVSRYLHSEFPLTKHLCSPPCSLRCEIITGHTLRRLCQLGPGPFDSQCTPCVICQAARALAAEDALRRWPPRAAAEAAHGAAKRKSDEWSVSHEEDVI